MLPASLAKNLMLQCTREPCSSGECAVLMLTKEKSLPKPGVLHGKC